MHREKKLECTNTHIPFINWNIVCMKCSLKPNKILHHFTFILEVKEKLNFNPYKCFKFIAID